MANTGAGGFLPGQAFIEPTGGDVFIKEQSNGDLFPKPADLATAITTLYGVEAVNTAQILTAVATADDGKYFLLPTSSSKYVIYLDEGGLGTSKPSVSGVANEFYVSVPFTDTDSAETVASAISTAINSHLYCSAEIAATVSTDTVTMTAKYGGFADPAIDGDLGIIATIGNTTPGTGDFDRVDKTAEGQTMTIEDDATFNTSQFDEIVLKKALNVEFSSANYTAHNSSVSQAKYDNKTCQVVFFDQNSQRKEIKTATVVINVKDTDGDESVQLITFTGTKKAKNVSNFRATYDMYEGD